MQGREIIVGISGGIAAYKSAALVSQLVQHGAQVSVVLTPAARHFVGAATFAALSGRAPHVELFGDAQFPQGAHIGLADRGDLLCIAPATANFLAKAATGLADDLLSTLYLAFTGPVLVAPAMNCDMWEKPAVQRNVDCLRSDGVQFVGPDPGWLSCRKTGAGRMAEPDAIEAALKPLLAEFECE